MMSLIFETNQSCRSWETWHERHEQSPQGGEHLKEATARGIDLVDGICAIQTMVLGEWTEAEAEKAPVVRPIQYDRGPLPGQCDVLLIIQITTKTIAWAFLVAL